MALKQGQWLSPDEKAFIKLKRLKQGFNDENINQEVFKTAKAINRQAFKHEERKVVEQEEKQKNIGKTFKEQFNELRTTNDTRPKRFETNYFRKEGELI